MKNDISYRDSVHRIGRVWILSALAMLIAVPVAICLYYRAWPSIGGVLKGMLSIAPIFWTVGVIEVFTYVPMLGTGGSYLGFVTGNLANLKVPCALNSMDRAGVQPGTEEGEVISTLAIATSSIITTLIIALGVLLLSQIAPVIESEALQPAFANILPALFGALGVVFISKDWKIAIAPLAVMITLFLLIPSLASAVGVLVPVGALIAIGVARVLYKAGMLDEKTAPVEPMD
ncbi:MAG: hypothetical protein GX417_04645 [Clostridiales bacterium]|nr:hypothetical protein [Clostridiales bacterium]